MTGDTVAWFESRGVALKIEEDGRMFPISDSSQSIISCFEEAVKRLGIEVLLQQNLIDLKQADAGFELNTTTSSFSAKAVVIAAGSSKKIWQLLADKGHTIIPPVPSLFTFNIDNEALLALQGLSQPATVELLNEAGKAWQSQAGPVLVTHWGLSGPGILKLSAVAARELAACDYKFNIQLAWLELPEQELFEHLKSLRLKRAKQQLQNGYELDIPKRLWSYLLDRSGLNPKALWSDQSNTKLQQLINTVLKDVYQVTGKSTYKDEFVTAGGVALSELNFKNFESKVVSGLYMAGEVINVDALTGGFNFQNAWTGAYLIAQDLSNTI
jgi:predicted Rossmann fold flavoprotein